MSLPLVFDAPRRARPPQHLADLDADGLREAVRALGLPAFRADQLSRQYFGRLTADVAAMTDLPTAARPAVADALFPPLLREVRHLETDAGTTRKTLWRLFDDTLVESVLMRYPARIVDGVRRPERITVCVSSQAGCGMACPFYATGQGGLKRNLSTAEIVDQVVAAARVAAAGELPGGAGRLSNVVFMGMGEPLANFTPVIRAVRILATLPDKGAAGMGISARKITISTVGLPKAIERLAAELELPVTLALSLHAPND